MTMGHYAGALIPYARNKTWPLWLLLACAQFGDLLWLVLALIGIEPTSPPDLFDASIASLQTHMYWSHGLVPVIGEAIVVGGLVFAFARDTRLAAWCGALVVAHLLEDFVCGFRHELWGPGSPVVGLGLYESHTGIYVSFAVEMAFAALCVTWYARTARPKHVAVLYAAFMGGCLILLPTATASMREAFQHFTASR